VEMNDLVLVSTDDTSSSRPTCSTVVCRRSTPSRAPGHRSLEDHFNWVFDGPRGAEPHDRGDRQGRGAGEHDEPTSYEQIRPGTTTSTERIKDMKANGVLAHCVSRRSRASRSVVRRGRQDRRRPRVRIGAGLHDWHIEDWCARIRAASSVWPDPIWDPQLIHGDGSSPDPREGLPRRRVLDESVLLGRRHCHDGHWIPLGKRATNWATVVCMHTGSGSHDPDVPGCSHLGAAHVRGSEHLPDRGDLVWSPMMKKFPHLMFALSEGEIGWVPHFLGGRTTPTSIMSSGPRSSFLTGNDRASGSRADCHVLHQR